MAVSQAAMAIPAAISGRANPCAEGDFFDIGEKQCKTLDKSFGFSWTTFDANHKPGTEVNITNCTDNNLRTAMQTIRNAGGGTINLPVCTLVIAKTQDLPPNMLIQGMGSDKTIITYNSGYSDNNLFRCNQGSGCKNIVVRDVQFKGPTAKGTKPKIMVIMEGVTNVMYERVHMNAAPDAGLLHPHSQKVTMRYIYAHDAKAGNLVGAKDCFSPSDKTGPKGSWSASDCGTGNYWSSDVLWMSILAHDGSNATIDGHISDFEVAGTHTYNAFYHGIKVPERAIRVWMHDNYMHNNGTQGIYSKSQSCGIANSDIQSRKHFVYRNRLDNNDKFGFINTYVTEAFLKNNRGAGNKSAEWSSSGSCSYPTDYDSPTTFLCGGGFNSGNGGSKTGVTYLNSSDPRCDLSNVGNVFP